MVNNCKDTYQPAAAGHCFKEAVCIDTHRIYDSVCDKNCLEDLQVAFSDEYQPVINNAIGVKLRSVEVFNVYLDVEPVPFNRGFYAVDITFFFLVKLNAQMPNMTQTVPVVGITTFTRKIILYGSEGNVKVFCSDNNCQNGHIKNQPLACLQVSDPVALACRLSEGCGCGCDCCCNIPQEICSCFKGNFGVCQPEKQVYITIGIFIIVQMERQVQMLIPTYDFCIPNKEPETPTTGDPCELFKKIKFPTND